MILDLVNIQNTLSSKYSVHCVLILGILKAVHCGVPSPQNRVTKDVVAFYAGDFPDLVEKLQLDLHEPPISQVSFSTLF